MSDYPNITSPHYWEITFPSTLRQESHAVIPVKDDVRGGECHERERLDLDDHG
jgi:hypothetical protein